MVTLPKSCVVERGTALLSRQLAGCFEVPRTNPSRAGLSVEMLFRLGFGCTAERFEETSPIAFGVKDAAHLIAARTIAVETPMLELYARGVLPVSNEAHFDFCIQRRVGLPIGVDIPRKDEP